MKFLFPVFIVSISALTYTLPVKFAPYFIKNIVVEDSMTELMISALKGDIQDVKRLLKEHAKDPNYINAQNDIGNTALMFAVMGGQTKVVQLLINNNAKIDIENQGQETAVSQASEGGFDNILQILIKAGANVNAGKGSAVIRAAISGHVKVLELLIKAGANLNVKDDSGYTPLMFAAQGGHIAVVNLLEKYINIAAINAKNDSGETALILAAMRGHTQVVKSLVQAGADVNAKDNTNHDAQNFAQYRGYNEIAHFLTLKAHR